MEKKIMLLLFPIKVIKPDILSGYIIPIFFYIICEIKCNLTRQDIKLIILIVICFAAIMFCFNRIKLEIMEKFAKIIWESNINNPSNNIRIIQDENSAIVSFLLDEEEREKFERIAFLNPEKLYFAIETIEIVNDVLFPMVLFVALLSLNIFVMIISIAILQIMKEITIRNCGIKDIIS